MTTALVFGGQGTEVPRMGLALAAEFPRARELLACASEHAGVDAERVLATGGPEARRTSVIQPLLTAVGLGAVAALADRGFAAALVAGHSLGEVSASCVQGAWSAERAIELAAVRGRAMEREALRHPGGMIAVACSEERLAELLRYGRAAGSVVLAAHNAPDEWVLSGEQPALHAIAARVVVTRLPVSGAWHSPAMAGAVEDVRAAAGPDERVAERIAGALVRPVQWASTMQTFATAGVSHVVIAGPGTIMRGLVYKNLGRVVRVSIVETLADVDAVMGRR